MICSKNGTRIEIARHRATSEKHAFILSPHLSDCDQVLDLSQSNVQRPEMPLILSRRLATCRVQDANVKLPESTLERALIPSQAV